MRIEIVPPERWPEVAAVFRRRKASLPDPARSIMIGALDGGKIVGFVFLQQQLHSEPLWVHPRWRGKLWWPSLAKVAAVAAGQAGFTQVWAKPDNAKSRRAAKLMGFAPEKKRFYRRRL